MNLDRDKKELVLKVVYASRGQGALDEVAALALRKPGSASAVVPGSGVRTFALRIPELEMEGLTLRLDVVGVSLDEATAGDELLKSDAVLVVAADQAEANATVERVRASCPPRTPIVILAQELLGVRDVMVVAGTDVNYAALKSVVKPFVMDALRQLD